MTSVSWSVGQECSLISQHAISVWSVSRSVFNLPCETYIVKLPSVVFSKEWFSSLTSSFVLFLGIIPGLLLEKLNMCQTESPLFYVLQALASGISAEQVTWIKLSSL